MSKVLVDDYVHFTGEEISKILPIVKKSRDRIVIECSPQETLVKAKLEGNQRAVARLAGRGDAYNKIISLPSIISAISSPKNGVYIGSKGAKEGNKILSHPILLEGDENSLLEEIDSQKFDLEISLSYYEIKELFNLVDAAMMGGSDNQLINSSCFYLKDSILYFIATDGRKIFIYPNLGNIVFGDNIDDKKIMVTNLSMKSVASLIKEDCKVSFNDRLFKVSSGGTSFVSPLSSEAPKPYELFLAAFENNATSVKLDMKNIQEFVSTISLLGGKFPQIVLSAKGDNMELVASATSGNEKMEASFLLEDPLDEDKELRVKIGTKMLQALPKVFSGTVEFWDLNRTLAITDGNVIAHLTKMIGV